MTDTLVCAIDERTALCMMIFWQRYPVPMHGGEKRWAFCTAGPWFVSWKEWGSERWQPLK